MTGSLRAEEKLDKFDFYGLLWLIADMTAIENEIELVPIEVYRDYLKEETGGRMQLWLRIFDITGEKKHDQLLQTYHNNKDFK